MGWSRSDQGFATEFAVKLLCMFAFLWLCLLTMHGKCVKVGGVSISLKCFKNLYYG